MFWRHFKDLQTDDLNYEPVLQQFENDLIQRLVPSKCFETLKKL